MKFPALLRRAAGLLVALALVEAPLNFASTRPAASWLLIGLLGAGALLWSAGLALGRAWPPAPGALLFGAGALAASVLPWAAGVWRPTTGDAFSASHFARVAARWPQSVILPDAGAAVALPAGLGLALWIVADLAQDRAWLGLFAGALSGAAVLVTLGALAQIAAHAAGLGWRDGERTPGNFWGPFFHHASAGAYLNSAWPVAAGLAGGFLRSRLLGALAIAATVLLLAAHATNVSRLAPVLALVGLGFLAWKFHWLADARARTAGAGVLLGAGLLAFVLGRPGELVRRWRLLDFSPAGESARPIPPVSTWPALVRDDLLIPNVYNPGALGDRGEAQLAALRAIAARPVMGHGPARWAAVASRFSADPYVRSFYLYLQFVHDDFLQAAVERGLAGLLALTFLLGGGVGAGLRALSAAPLAAAPAGCAAVALALVLVQAFVDFPLQIPAVALNAHVLAGLGWAGRSAFRSSSFA